MSSAVVCDPCLTRRLTPQGNRCWIYHLPTELLVHIFRIVYDCEVPDGHGGERLFPFERVRLSGCDLRHNKAAIYLERSRRAPLEVVIAFDVGEEDADIRTTTELLEKLDATMAMIIPHICRWQSLEIIALDYSQFVHPTLVRLGACVGAPMLEVLHISNHAFHFERGVGEEFKRQEFVLFHETTDIGLNSTIGPCNTDSHMVAVSQFRSNKSQYIIFGRPR